MAQVTRWPVTVEPPVRFQVSPCETCEQSGSATRNSRSNSVFPCQYHSTIAPYLSSSTSDTTRTKGRSLGVEKYFHLVFRCLIKHLLFK
jgi:hypothetical protein